MHHTTRRNVRVAIIGTAGRKEDAVKMNKKVFDGMYTYAKYLIEHELHLSWKNVVLVSGGAAWADHVAVELFLSHPVPQLELFLPAPLVELRDGAVVQFEENPLDPSDPARVSNYYHRCFTRETGLPSLHRILMAKKRGAAIDEKCRNFYERNVKVARAGRDVVIAFTWGPESAAIPKSGGTLHTWKLSKAPKKIHISLDSLETRLMCADALLAAAAAAAAAVAADAGPATTTTSTESPLKKPRQLALNESKVL